MKRYYTVLFLALEFASCGDSVHFEAPQPQGQADLPKIPAKLYGEYYCAQESEILIINGDQIIKKWSVQFKIHQKDIDSTLELRGDSLIERHTGKAGKITIEGDTIAGTWSFTESVFFSISAGSKLRKFKGYYILNTEVGENNWDVSLLSQEGRNKIRIEQINFPTELSQLKEISAVKEIYSDSGKVKRYLLNPTRRQMKRLMEYGSKASSVYFRVKND